MKLAAVLRWLHIYVSLLSFAALVFFGVTGITLNHPDWFGADTHRTVEYQGSLKPEWLGTASSDSDAESNVSKLEIVEHLRSTHRLRGSVAEFRVDDRECLILFKSPGYSADAVIDRTTANYTVNVTMMGVVAIMNDFHKGRDTGLAWSVMIDAVSALTVFVSVTGLLLILYIRRKRLTGILTTVAGTALFIAVAIWLVK
jgi:hypothetical protein